MSKIDIHGTKKKYEAALKYFKEAKDVIPKNKELILSFVNDCELGKTIKHKEKKKIGESRCLKYLTMLKMISVWLKKPFDKVDQDDMEKFVMNLEKDRVLTKQHGKYGDETKADIKKVIKKFYKWLLGNNDHYPEIVSWIDTFVKPKEIPALSREEIDRMVEQTSKVRDKALIMLLFDSGARIEEFLNIRLKHLAKKDDYYQVRIEFSKTKPRTISLPLSTKYIEEWLAVHPDKNNSEAQLIPGTYASVRATLQRIGQRVLKKGVHPHLLRHSSATYYCNRLNTFQLAYRYGWSMSSEQPARYIDREGIHEEETAQIIKTDEVGKVRKENKELQENVTQLKVDYDEMREIMEKMNRFMTPLAKNQKFLKRLEGR